MANRGENELLRLLEVSQNILTIVGRGREKKVIYSDQKIPISELSKTIKEFWSSFRKNRIVDYFWKRGNLLTFNDFLSPQMLKEFCKSIDYSTEFREKKSSIDIIFNYLQQENKKPEISYEKSLVISVMGHIDHGKSTLLDTIRQTKFQKEEEGGITQKVSVRPLLFNDKQFTFLDTPGHQLFIKMRERGTSITDLVVLVIEGNDGIMPQTEEIITHIHNHKIPVIVFVNNKTREVSGAEKNVNKIMSQLQERRLTPAEWGGDVIVVSGNALEKESTNRLLDNINDLSELYSQKVNLNSTCRGIIIDSYISQKEGKSTVVLIKEGSLNVKDLLLVNGKTSRVKSLEDFSGIILEKALPGQIVKVWGIEIESSPGDHFLVVNNEKLARKIAKAIPQKKTLKEFADVEKISFDEKEECKIFNLILISDSPSSLEVLQAVVKNSSKQKMIFNTVYLHAGNITDSLITDAKNTESSFVVFNVKISSKTLGLLRDNKIKLVESSIIYQIEEKLSILANSLVERKKVEKVIGICDVIKVFQFSEVGSIAGCTVKSGTINRNHLINVFRGDKKILSGGKISGLQKDKKPAKEAAKNQECGVVVHNFPEFIVGDQIISYSMVDEEDVKERTHKK